MRCHHCFSVLSPSVSSRITLQAWVFFSLSVIFTSWLLLPVLAFSLSLIVCSWQTLKLERPLSLCYRWGSWGLEKSFTWDHAERSKPSFVEVQPGFFFNSVTHFYRVWKYSNHGSHLPLGFSRHQTTSESLLALVPGNHAQRERHFAWNPKGCWWTHPANSWGLSNSGNSSFTFLVAS